MIKDDNYLQVASAAAKEAGPIFEKFFGKAGKPKIKAGDAGNLVTKIDLRIEKLIRRHILKSFPDAKIIGEEFGSSELKKDDVVWLIDPIDGTTNFIRGIPLCCICIGVWDKDGPLAGLVFNPIVRQTYTAARGKGAFLNAKRIRVSEVSKLKDASGAVGWQSPQAAKKIFNQIIGATRKLRILATSAWQTCMVANGQLDYYATRDVHIWDVGASAIILLEAGGAITDFKGYPSKINLLEVIASNGKLQKEIIQKFKSPA